MSMIQSSDPDFHVCRISFDALLEIQLRAEQQGWVTRWSSVEALRSQVKEEPLILQSLLREERGGVVRAYRCLLLFSGLESGSAGGVVTIDLDPAQFESLERLNLDPHARKAFARVFTLASGGISMVSKR